MQTIVVKIGTQSVTTAEGALDRAVLKAQIRQLAQLKQQGHFVVLVSSGAVGIGRQILGSKNNRNLPDPITTKQIAAALGQARLIEAWQQELQAYKMQAAQVLLTKQDFQTRNHYLNIQRLFDGFRQQGDILPIVNENDSVAVQELMFTDNDELASLVAMQLQADRVIILSAIPGVFDRDPHLAGATVLPLLDPEGVRAPALPTVSLMKTASGRGGMVSKLASARKLSKVGIATHIADAREADIVLRIVAGDRVGTTILPARKTNPTKRYLASGQGQLAGSVTANDCLAERMRSPSQVMSILPVGLTACAGDFAKGDMVAVHAPDGTRLAIGIARYGAEQLKTHLGQPRMPVFLHYDSLFREV